MPSIKDKVEAPNSVGTAPFPVPAKRATGLINGTPTEISSQFFADKILVTISQAGLLSQWIQVRLSSTAPAAFHNAVPDLTPETLLGGGSDERNILGHVYATQIAKSILMRNREEDRILLIGFGLLKAGTNERSPYFDLMELVATVL